MRDIRSSLLAHIAHEPFFPYSFFFTLEKLQDKCVTRKAAPKRNLGITNVNDVLTISNTLEINIFKTAKVVAFLC